MALATDAWLAAWRCCSARTMSSAIMPRDGEVAFERGAQRRAPDVVFARPMQHLHQVRVVRVLRESRPRARSGRRRFARHRRRRRAGRCGSTRISSAEPAEVLDQRELEHARPGPQLTERQRRDPLIAVEEQRQLRQVEPAVGVAEQRDRHRVDARFARFLRGPRAPAAGGSSGAADARESRPARTRSGGSYRGTIRSPA